MIVEDVILMIGGFIFAPSLIVSIAKRASYPLGTSLPTALSLMAFTGCYISLGLNLAALSTGLTTLCWWALVFGRSQ